MNNTEVKDMDSLIIDFSTHLANASVISILSSYLLNAASTTLNMGLKVILHFLVILVIFFVIELFKSVYKKTIKQIYFQMTEVRNINKKAAKGYEIFFIFIYISFWVLPPVYSLSIFK